MISLLNARFSESIELKEETMKDNIFIENVIKAKDLIIKSLELGGTIYFCGNGGSAADAQHLSAELSGRYYIDRKALKSEALHCNTSYVTAVANDYGYNQIYSRLVEGALDQKDLLIGLTTSGNSENIANAFEAANKKDLKTISLTGGNGGAVKKLSSININVNSNDIPRIQEIHMLVGHSICEQVEKEIFG